MADEAVVRIVLDAPTSVGTAPQQVRATPQVQPPPITNFTGISGQKASVPLSGSELSPDYLQRQSDRKRKFDERLAAEAAEVRKREEERREANAAPESTRAEVPVSDNAPSSEFFERQKERKRGQDERFAVEAAEADRNARQWQAANYEPERAEVQVVDVAKARVEAEKGWVEAGKEYAKIDPVAATNSLGAMLEALESVRGSIGSVGGVFGRVAAAALDVTARFRRMRAAQDAARADVVPTKTPEDIARLDSEIAKRESHQPEPDSPMGKRLAGLKAERAEVAATEGGTQDAVAASGLAASAPYVAAALAVVGVVAGVVNKLVNVADGMVRRYAEYSPEIAQAQATAEINTMVGDMRRAQENSEELADYVRAQSELYNKWEDMKAAFMKQMLPVMTGIMNALDTLTGVVSKSEAESRDPTSMLLGGMVDQPEI